MPSLRGLLLPCLLLLAPAALQAAEPPPGGAPAPAPAPAPPAAPAQPAVPAVPAVTVPTFANSTCPIMGKPASLALFTDTDCGRIYVCCPPCMAKIKKDPAAACKTAYPVVKKAGNTVCPVTDKPLVAGSTTVVLQGYEIGVCADCVARARANAQVTLAKATNPAVVDIGNLTCPITAGPVVANAFCLVGTDLIRLSSPKAVDEVKKDPAKALKTAKEIAARQRAAAAQAPPAGTPPTGVPPSR